MILDWLEKHGCVAICRTKVEPSSVVIGSIEVNDVARVKLLNEYLSRGETGVVLKNERKLRQEQFEKSEQR